MGIFNLIPAYPMDGGRILRSALSMFFPYEKATGISIFISSLISIIFIAIGIIYNWVSLVIVATFLMFANYKFLKLFFKKEDGYERKRI